MLEHCSASLAHYIASAGERVLPAPVIHDFKRALLDYSTCVLTGTHEPVVQALLDCLPDGRTDTPRTVKCLATRLNGTDAALIHGVRAHALDFDDGYTQGSCHPGAPIFSAAFAAAKKYGANPERIVRAVVLGYDIMLRVAATGHPTTAQNGFHNTAIAGVFGAAAAAAVVLGLDSTKANHTLGLAASFAGGVLEFLEDGSDSKRLHAGKAARDGLLCAEMAARGISGPERGLEGKFGFFKAFARGEIRPQFLLEGLGERFLIANAYFKLYPCCRHYHAAIDAARALREEEPFDIADIERVVIGLYALAVEGHDQKAVHTLLEAQMSAPCAISLALLDQNVAIQSFNPDSLARAAFLQLMQKMETRVDAVCEDLYPRVRSGVVTIYLKDGRTLEQRVENPKGEEANPLTDEELEEKFVSNVKGIITDQQISQVIALIRNFERDGAALLGELF